MSLSRGMVVALIVLATSSVSAQDPDQDQHPASFVSDVVKQVILDPTTYAPAIVGWGAKRLDWASSQVFFQNGWVEHNSRFTVSGRSDDIPIGYAAGNRRILKHAVANLQLSLVNNVSMRVVERVLMRRFPNHRRLVRAIGWIERSAMASYFTHRLSTVYFRQWQENERLARQLGYD